MNGGHPLAPYACQPGASRGRLYPEPESATRTCFQRDRDRILHSAAFRRLQYKTQVFVNHEGDFYRTRLTHSLEVAQIARSVSRSLGLNEDLAEAVALAHDLGHPPFGHAGEDALKDAMKPFSGFDHNAQTLAVITRLEHRYIEFPGLNLTWEAVEGVVKHNGPLGDGAFPAIVHYSAGHDLELNTYAGAEAQVAAIADDIAYNNHDIEDGLRAGLFTQADIADVPLAGPMFTAAGRDHPDAEPSQIMHEAVRRMFGAMVADLLAETGRRLDDARPGSADDVRALPAPIADFSAAMTENVQSLKTFLEVNMYRHYKLNRMTSKARRVVRDLFNLLVAEPECLPSEWRRRAAAAGTQQTAELVTDYIAGMTDRFALDEHRRLFDMQAKTS
jgi:dGTPase